MCGIGGFYGIDADKKLLNRMNELMAHRGPDGCGTFVAGSAGLAHRRLVIIDKKGGDQPMRSRDGRYVVVLNGEIYNYIELRDELRLLGYEFETNSDTEVVLAAYVQWGEECLDRFNGMWGLAIYDSEKDELILSRDHFGIKPVYWARAGKGVVFCSELTPIVESGLIEKAPNDRIIYRYLNFRVHDDGRETFFAGAERLLPGELMRVSSKGVKVKVYTTLYDDLKKLARKGSRYDRKAKREYRERLEAAIRLRLRSDVPVGTSLSGGLDSSAVAVLVSRLMEQEKGATASVGGEQNVFSAIFPGSANDEEKYVNAAVEACGEAVKVHKVKPKADEFKVDLLEFLRTQEEPTISTGPYAQYEVMREASKHVTVLLDGQGADETMAGYLPYYFVYLRQLRSENVWHFLGESLSSLDVLAKFGWMQLKGKFKKKMSMRALLDGEFAGEYRSEKFTTVQNNLKLRLMDDLFKNSIPALLRYEDRNTMHFGLEGRVPFLDKDLVSFVFSLEDEAIIKRGWNKRILRDSLTGVLPEMIRLRRNKIGFTTPEHEWFMRLKNFFYGVFMSEEFKGRKYFDQTAVVEAFEGFVSGKNTLGSMTFWRMACVELWLRQYFDAPKPEPKHKASDFEPNKGKKLTIEVGGNAYARYPLRTEAVTRETKLGGFIVGRVEKTLGALKGRSLGEWHVVVSEKIVAITQGRSYFLWDIEPSWSARILSKFVQKTPHGIGLGSPFTMELAIREAGLPRILWASVAGAFGKLIGKKGWFYIAAGSDVRAIDGPTEYSVYPANVSAKLAPKDPNGVAKRLDGALRKAMPEKYAKSFAGVVIIDANDLGRNILGKSTDVDDEKLAAMFADNPSGQGHEQTPIVVVEKK